MMESSGDEETVRAVYALREAAVAHGKAEAVLESQPSAAARDALLTTQTDLEEKTMAALDECSEHAEEAADDAASGHGAAAD